MRTTKAQISLRGCAFVIHCFDSIIPLVSIPKISSLYLASVAAQAGLSLPRLQTPKTDFLVTWLILSMYIFCCYSAYLLKTTTQQRLSKSLLSLWLAVL